MRQGRTGASALAASEWSGRERRGRSSGEEGEPQPGWSTGGAWPRGGAAEPPLPLAPRPLRGLFLSRARRLMEVRWRSHPGVHWLASPWRPEGQVRNRQLYLENTQLPGQVGGCCAPSRGPQFSRSWSSVQKYCEVARERGRMVSNLKMRIHGPGHRARFTVCVRPRNLRFKQVPQGEVQCQWSQTTFKAILM